jgi:hypothetical protein
MSTVLTILQKTLVNHFYRVNAGFFLFMFHRSKPHGFGGRNAFMAAV